MGNFYKYNDKVSGGTSGLTTADGGDAIADNEIIRGDGTTGIQGGVLTSADHNGDIAGPTASTDTTIAGQDFGNQPANDGVTVVSDAAGDTTQTITIIGTTTGTDTVVTEDIVLNGVVAVNSVKVNWGQILAAKLSAACAGTVTIKETSGGLTITTIAPASTSKGVDTGSISCWNRVPYVVASGASTKQIGLKGTNSAGATIYDSQALTGATSLLMNSAFVTVTEYYVGDLESTRTATITAQDGTKIGPSLLVDNLKVDGNTISATNTNGGVALVPNGSGLVNLFGTTSSDPAIDNNSNQFLFKNGDGSEYVVTQHGGLILRGPSGSFNTIGQWYGGDDVGHMYLSANAKIGWDDSATEANSRDTTIGRIAEGQMAVASGTNGHSTNIKSSSTTVNLAGATTTATGLFPAKCIQLGVTCRVTTLVASGDGGTSMNIGDGSDADRYGATIAFAAGTTVNLSNATADPRGWAAAAGDVVFTCVGGTFNAGVVRVVAHYLDLTASTS